ncbi:hypothetical protein Pan241w_36790 [Gimesia alba]|uniref:Uncharacterized protein n=1 Tax=Gimesia alba TaxID=2527973 RepID=A0A517RI68_9PLAN|nr:hypothetical protein [Gimesia alba]QDT43577.1 hypothetical protein Pan241w_36790 [Gimesia alba]
MAQVTGKQITKSICLTLIGAAPGTIWFFNVGTTQSIVIGCLGALIGFGLSLPGVSAARVAGGTVGMIAANNAPRRMQGQIMDTFVGEKETPESQPNPESDDEVDESKPET